jgi:hypothetical protein
MNDSMSIFEPTFCKHEPFIEKKEGAPANRLNSRSRERRSRGNRMSREYNNFNNNIVAQQSECLSKRESIEEIMMQIQAKPKEPLP